MPYNNAYNQNIARQLNNLYKNKVKYENANSTYEKFLVIITTSTAGSFGIQSY
jgi:hypothetical protein